MSSFGGGPRKRSFAQTMGSDDCPKFKVASGEPVFATDDNCPSTSVAGTNSSRNGCDKAYNW